MRFLFSALARYEWCAWRRAQVENVECLANNHIKFDFLGKDSIRYENEVAVEPRVWQLVKQFCRGDKKAGARQAVFAHAGTSTLRVPLGIV